MDAEEGVSLRLAVTLPGWPAAIAAPGWRGLAVFPNHRDRAVRVLDELVAHRAHVLSFLT